MALLESGGVDPQQAFNCQGYLHSPAECAAQIYVRQGVGHGDVTLADALAQSCNVYFFHYAGQMGPGPLVDWAARLGFGRPTGVDLPGEAAGILPTPQSIRRLEGHAWRTADTQVIGHRPGLAHCHAAAGAADDGRRGHRQAASRRTWRRGDRARGRGPRAADPPQPIDGLRPATLAAIRRGLERTVADPKGTAYGTVMLESIAVAGKTGTAVGEAAAITPGLPAMPPPAGRRWPSSSFWSTPATGPGRRPRGQAAGNADAAVGDAVAYTPGIC